MQAHGLTLALMHTCTQSIKMKVFPTLWLAIFSFLNFFLILSSYNKVSWFIRKNKKKSLKLFKHIYTTVQEATVCRVKEMNIVCTICQSWHNGWLSQDGPYSLSTGIKENSVCLSYFWQGTLQDKILDRQFWTLSDKENYCRLNTGVSTNPVRWDLKDRLSGSNQVMRRGVLMDGAQFLLAEWQRYQGSGVPWKKSISHWHPFQMLSAMQSGKTGPWLEPLSQGQILVLMRFSASWHPHLGKRLRGVTGHVRSHLEGSSSRESTTVISTHQPFYSWWNSLTWLTLSIPKSVKLLLSFLM